MYKLEVIYNTITEAMRSLVEEDPDKYSLDEKPSRGMNLLTIKMDDGSERMVAMAAYKYTSQRMNMRNQDAIRMEATNASVRIIPFDHPKASLSTIRKVIEVYINAQAS